MISVPQKHSRERTISEKCCYADGRFITFDIGQALSKYMLAIAIFSHYGNIMGISRQKHVSVKVFLQRNREIEKRSVWAFTLL